MTNTMFGTFNTEAEKLDAMRYEIMEAGKGRSGDSDAMLRKFWETLESGLPLVVEDDYFDEVYGFANIFSLIAEWPAVSITDIQPADGMWRVFISD